LTAAARVSPLSSSADAGAILGTRTFVPGQASVLRQVFVLRQAFALRQVFALAPLLRQSLWEQRALQAEQRVVPFLFSLPADWPLQRPA